MADDDTETDVSSGQIQYTEADITKILISTDNHVGFMERDPIRGGDSFAAFEEVLATARSKKVDLVLLAGDLFHENKPSRYTLWRTMEILRKYVMGYDPVRIQILSDYNASRVLGSWGQANAAATKAATVAAAAAASASSEHAATTSSTTTSRGRSASTARGKPQPPPAKRGKTGHHSSSSGNKDDDNDDNNKDDDGGGGEEDSGGGSSSSSSAIVTSGPGGASSSSTHGGLFHRVNFEDPNYNIDLPIFSIHGNHDDPSREGPGGDILAALDILSVANLVNYFGKSESADTIEVSPVLFAKGQTRVALYGLGNIRDDRLYRILLADKIRFRRPAEDPDAWFSLMLIHQNRTNRTSMRGRAGSGGSVGVESILPGFLDVVVWGHEHECKPNLTTALTRQGGGGGGGGDGSSAAVSAERSTRVIQPGSTVATSLCEGEAERKHVIFLEIRGTQFRGTGIPLRCIRPFRIEDVSLSESGINPDSATVDEDVTQFLRKCVETAITQCTRERNSYPPGLQPPLGMQLPLIRIKVDHSGFRVLSNQRFGAAFVGKVANPADLLLFYRRPVFGQGGKGIRTAAGAKGSATGGGAGGSALLRPIMPTELHSLRVEDLVSEQLAVNREAGRGLKVVSQDKLLHAMGKYIDGDAVAIRETVDDTVQLRTEETAKHQALFAPEAVAEYNRDKLRAMMTDISAGITAKEEEEQRKRDAAAGSAKAEPADVVSARERDRQKAQAALRPDSEYDQEEEEEEDEESGGGGGRGGGRKSVGGRGGGATAKKRGGAAGRGGGGTASSSGRQRKQRSSEDEDKDESNYDDDMEDQEEADGGARRRGGKKAATAKVSTTGRGGRGGAAAAASTRGRGRGGGTSPARGGGVGTKRSRARSTSSGDDDDDYDDDGEFAPLDSRDVDELEGADSDGDSGGGGGARARGRSVSSAKQSVGRGGGGGGGRGGGGGGKGATTSSRSRASSSRSSSASRPSYREVDEGGEDDDDAYQVAPEEEEEEEVRPRGASARPRGGGAAAAASRGTAPSSSSSSSSSRAAATAALANLPAPPPSVLSVMRGGAGGGGAVGAGGGGATAGGDRGRSVSSGRALPFALSGKR